MLHIAGGIILAMLLFPVVCWLLAIALVSILWVISIPFQIIGYAVMGIQYVWQAIRQGD